MSEHAYIHVPFCKSICHYCAFCRSGNLTKINGWHQRILSEIKETIEEKRKENPSFSLSTLYFGGGTPSLLPLPVLKDLMDCFTDILGPDAEVTLEVNPESADMDKLQAWKEMGINRLSVGIQSFNDGYLKQMGRNHSAKQASGIIEMARFTGITNISADLIYAMPWQSLDDVKTDVEEFLKLDLPHLSIYSLILEENSVFGKQNIQGWDEDAEADGYEMIVSMLEKAGYHHYEISSFARDGMYSGHNLSYWQDQNYMGFGYGAWGRDAAGYYQCGAVSLQDYLEHGYQKVYMEDQNPAFEAIMMGLRTSFGIDISAWNARYKKDLEAIAKPVMEKYPGTLQIEKGRLSATRQGMEILNTLLVEFMDGDC